MGQNELGNSHGKIKVKMTAMAPLRNWARAVVKEMAQILPSGVGMSNGIVVMYAVSGGGA